MNILSAIMAKPLLYLCGLLLVLCIGLFAWGKIQTMRLGKEKEENATLQGQIKLQNKLILDWQAKAEEQKKRVAEAKKEAERIKKESGKRIEEILKAQLPAKCEDKEIWLKERLQSLQSQW